MKERYTKLYSVCPDKKNEKLIYNFELRDEVITYWIKPFFVLMA